MKNQPDGTGAVIQGNEGDYIAGMILALGRSGNLFFQLSKPFGTDKFQLDGRIRVYVDDIVGPESQDEKYEIHVVPKDLEVATNEERAIKAAMLEATYIAMRYDFEPPRWIEIKGGIETLPDKLQGIEGITMWQFDSESEAAAFLGVEPREPVKPN